jgi:acetoin utilization protein AcuC
MTRPMAIFMHGEAFERLSYPASNPFKTWRARRTRELLKSLGLMYPPRFVEREPVPATREELLKLHDARYLDAMEAAEAGRYELAYLEMGLGIEECPVFVGMCEYGRNAVGASLTGARALLAGEAPIVFNPSGGFHHAMRGRAAGFCYLNDVALACLELADAGKRVLYLDVDVHHGDGVQEAFYERSDVLTISLHQDPATLFPGTGYVGEIGRGAGEGYCVNVPMPRGAWDDAWLAAFRKVVPPLAKAFAPDVMVVEFGMDALANDPMAQLELTNNAYADVAEWVRDFGVPVLATGGGGYHPENSARGWALVWSVLTGQDEAQADLSLGMGGVFMQSSEWGGGLRDLVRVPEPDVVDRVSEELGKTLRTLRQTVFSFHDVPAGT